MPGVTLHFVLARRALDVWEREGESAPFDTRDPALVNAFRNGALGPDLGYFPGGDRFLSELSHFVHPAGLTRALVHSAETPEEHAFAWGWVTHVLGDVTIHPLIGRAVGSVHHGSFDHFVDGATDLPTHVRVELGLDCWYAKRHPDARGRRLKPVFDAGSVEWLRKAYADTYGVDLPDEWFLRSHRLAGRGAAHALATLWIVGALMGGEGGSVALPRVRRVLRAAYRSPRFRGVSLAYLNPIEPSGWLRDQVEAAIPVFTDRFRRLVRYGVDHLEDRNLDTGLLCAESNDHQGTTQAVGQLVSMGAAPTGLEAAAVEMAS